MATSSVVIEGEPQHLAEVEALASIAYDNWHDNPALKDASKFVFDVDKVFSKHPQLLKTIMACEETLLELSATDTCSGIFYAITLKAG